MSSSRSSLVSIVAHYTPYDLLSSTLLCFYITHAYHSGRHPVFYRRLFITQFTKPFSIWSTFCLLPLSVHHTIHKTFSIWSTSCLLPSSRSTSSSLTNVVLLTILRNAYRTTKNGSKMYRSTKLFALKGLK